MHVIGGAIDMAWVREFSQAHERAGFDKVLVGYTSTAADGCLVSAYAAAHTERLGYLLAHRPGFVAPTLAARKAATLDQLSGGRLALHIITGGSDADQARDGDFVDHDRYRRTDEYLGLMRRMWTEARPFDHAGEFYRVTAAYSDVKPVQQPHVPLYFGGASEAAHRIGVRHCDVYMLWGEPLAAIRDRIAGVRAAAAGAGREPGLPRFSVSLRPIIAPTEAQAWAKARAILEQVQAKQGARGVPQPEAVGAAARTSPSRPRCTTSGCGRRSRRRWAARAIPPRCGHARAGGRGAPGLSRPAHHAADRGFDRSTTRSSTAAS